MTALAIGLALAAAAIHGTWNVLVKVSGDPMRTFRRATAIAALVITPITAVAWAVAGRPSLTPTAAGLAAVSAGLELLYLVLLSAAYRRGELSVAAIEQLVQHQSLALVEIRILVYVPEFGLGQHRAQDRFRAGESAV